MHLHNTHTMLQVIHNKDSPIYLARASDSPLKTTRSELTGCLESARFSVVEEPIYSRSYRTFLRDVDRSLNHCVCLVSIFDETISERADFQVLETLQRHLKRTERRIPPGLLSGFNSDLSDLTLPEFEIILALHRNLPIFVYARQATAFISHLQNANLADCQVIINSDEKELLSRSLKDLGDFISTQGDGQRAGLLYRHCLDYYNDEETLKVANDFGVMLTSGQKYKEAEELFRKSWELKKRFPGDEHPSTLNTLNNLCDVLRMKGDYEEAARLSEECYQIRRRVLGARHPDTIDSLNDSALLLDADRAEQRLRYGLTICQEALTEDHPATLRTQKNLANVLQSQGDYTVAEQILGELNGSDVDLRRATNQAQHDHNPRPFFSVGIIGHMNLPEGAEALLEQKVRDVLLWLKKQHYPNGSAGFGEPLGLDKTPIVLLSSLAPGADQLAAKVALEEGLEVRCPLPFPYEMYRIGSTFNSTPVISAINRQEKLDGLIDRIGLDNTFVVTHADDHREYQPYLNDQLKDKEFRNRRFRASGEFIAANCDLLIAICDQEEALEEPNYDPELSPKAQCGTRIIISSYINGIDSGILPLPPTLSWQENGPVVRVFAPRNGVDDSTYQSEVGDVKIWHPVDAESAGQFHDQVHSKEMGELRLVADRLEKLNNDLDRSPKVEFNPTEMFQQSFAPYRPRNTIDRLLHFGQACDWREMFHTRFDRILAFLPGRNQPIIEKPLPPLDRIVSFKRRVDIAVSRYDKQVAFLTNVPFIMGFLVFLIYEFHGLLQDVDFPNPVFWAIVSFYSGVILLALGILFHSWANSWGAFDRKNDYRALIEGTRVQFYWAAAGIKERVPSHYVQRLSGEIAWIKSAISSITMPIESTTEQFDGLETHREKCGRLRDVWQGWVCSVENFFSGETHLYSKLHGFFQLWGNLLLSASAFMIFITFAHDWLVERPVYLAFMNTFHFLKYNGLIVWVALASGLWVLHQWIVSRAYRSIYDTKVSDGSVRVFNLWKKFDNKFTRIVAGLSLGLTIYSAIHFWFGTHGENVDHRGAHAEHSDLFIAVINLARNTLFTVGGLFLGYSVVKFTSENSRRYELMRGQFGAARKKIGGLLDRYESLIEQDATETDLLKRVELEREMLRLQKAVQGLFVTLGKEALHENTEWLLMRRNRPVEPVSPVG